MTANNLWSLREMADPAKAFEPRKSPPLAVARRTVKRILLRTSLLRRKKPQPWPNAHAIRELDGWLRSAGLEKVKAITLAFGPFTFFYHKLFPTSLGIDWHHRLQRLADQDVGWIRSAGAPYLAPARKPR